MRLPRLRERRVQICRPGEEPRNDYRCLWSAMSAAAESVGRSVLGELIADSAHGQNPFRLAGVLFQFLTQPADMDVECSPVQVLVLAPNQVQQPVARNDPP